MINFLTLLPIGLMVIFTHRFIVFSNSGEKFKINTTAIVGITCLMLSVSYLFFQSFPDHIPGKTMNNVSNQTMQAENVITQTITTHNVPMQTGENNTHIVHTVNNELWE